jgi:hypothetical protein
MFMNGIFWIVVGLVLSLGMSHVGNASQASLAEQNGAESLRFLGETHFSHIRQLTFGGQNAEAYFSYDGTELIFQATRDGQV